MNYFNGKFAMFYLDEIGTITDAKIGRMIEESDRKKRRVMFNEIKKLLPKMYSGDSSVQINLIGISTGCDAQGSQVVFACYEVRPIKKEEADVDANPE